MVLGVVLLSIVKFCKESEASYGVVSSCEVKQSKVLKVTSSGALFGEAKYSRESLVLRRIAWCGDAE